MKEIKKENTKLIQTIEEKLEVLREKVNEVVIFCNKLEGGKR